MVYPYDMHLKPQFFSAPSAPKPPFLNVSAHWIIKVFFLYFFENFIATPWLIRVDLIVVSVCVRELSSLSFRTAPQAKILCVQLPKPFGNNVLSSPNRAAAPKPLIP